MNLHDSPTPHRVLEAAHLHRLEAERLRRLRSSCERERLRTELGAELELRDGPLLDRLLDLGIVPDTASAFEAIPLVRVAWADGSMASEERWNVLRAATGVGLELGSPAHAQLELWLAHPPDEAMFEAWLAFAHGQRRDRAHSEKARRLLLEIRRIAEVSGGLLGFLAVSAAERDVISRVEAAVGEDDAPTGLTEAA